MNNIPERLLQLELSLFMKSVLADNKRLNELIHDDFYEVGSSGTVYDKATILTFLQGSAIDRPIEILEFHIKPLTEDFVWAFFVTLDHSSGKRARRTSLWKFSGTWQLLFHQGTPLGSSK